MARKLRIEYPGAIYHVMNRGDRREPIVMDDQDRLRFLKALDQACAKTDWQVHALCRSMGNHFHLALETPLANLVAGMKWFLATYTSRFNRRHRLAGHLFGGRYKALIVDGSSSGYLKTVCDYVHLNPVRAGLFRADQPMREYRWSSYPLYLKALRRRPEWLAVRRLFGEWNIRRDDPAGRREFGRQMEARRQGERQEEYKAVRRGWCLGGKPFRQELLDQIAEQRGDWHYGRELHESDEARAERLIDQELKRKGWEETDLEKRRKSDRFKVQLATRLRAETTMTMSWIAQRLKRGTRGHLAQLLYRCRRPG